MMRWLWFFVWCVPLAAQAQFTYVLDQSIPVRDLSGDELKLAWAGGLNATNVNTMDLDGDGNDDMVLFDRMAGKVITFVSIDNQYTAAPEYEDLFPTGITNWLLLRDYNCDGKKDIFTGDNLGIKVYTNTTSSPGVLTWEPYLFSTGYPGVKSTVLQTEGFNSKVNLQLQRDDLPSISDVDGDGDLDIFNIQYAGHTVEFHQNLSIENGLPCDSMEFKRITRSWGNFSECRCGVLAFNGEPCPPDSGGRTQHAGGKSLLTLDLNGDGAQDLLFSEAGCTQIYALMNQGTTSSPVINSASPFPQTQPVNMVIFPAPFFEDVDFDGKKDLIATPNIFTKEYLNTNLDQSVWFYKNTGTASLPAFSFVERNFIQGAMIDIGDNAIPAFTDFDGDGDFDMLVSSHSSERYTSTVSLYENKGTPSSPSFALATDDFLGFSTAAFYNVKIQFADINSDQMQDLVFSATSFENNLTNLYFFPNKSSARLDFSGASLQLLDFPLSSGENVCVTDVNSDGLPDILVGRSAGNLEYWKNSGIKGSPSFQLEDENFLGFASSPFRQNLSCASADLDGDGKTDLVIGDQSGQPGVISDFQSAGANESQLERNIVFNPALEVYGSKNLGGRIWPTVVNLFNTNRPAVVVGNALGGIHVLRNDQEQSLPDEPQMNIYPNPVPKRHVLNIRADRAGTMQLVSVLGQQLSPVILLNANETLRYTLPSLASGLYLVKFTANRKSSTQRFVIE